MSHTVASYLREKMTNMANWLHEEGLQLTALPTKDMTDIELVTLAHLLTDYDDAIKARDFDGFGRYLEAEIKETLAFVRSKVYLHDKFWRYLELFSEVASTHE